MGSPFSSEETGIQAHSLLLTSVSLPKPIPQSSNMSRSTSLFLLVARMEACQEDQACPFGRDRLRDGYAGVGRYGGGGRGTFQAGYTLEEVCLCPVLALC